MAPASDVDAAAIMGRYGNERRSWNITPWGRLSASVLGISRTPYYRTERCCCTRRWTLAQKSVRRR